MITAVPAGPRSGSSRSCGPSALTERTGITIATAAKIMTPAASQSRSWRGSCVGARWFAGCCQREPSQYRGVSSSTARWYSRGFTAGAHGAMPRWSRGTLGNRPEHLAYRPPHLGRGTWVPLRSGLACIPPTQPCWAARQSDVGRTNRAQGRNGSTCPQSGLRRFCDLRLQAGATRLAIPHTSSDLVPAE